MTRPARIGRTIIVGLAMAVMETSATAADPPPTAAPGPPEYKVAFWFDRRDPLNTFRFQAYDLRKSEYTPAVDEWLAVMRASYPGYRAYVKEVRARSGSELATAILAENLAVGGPNTGAGIRDSGGLGGARLLLEPLRGYSSAYSGPSSTRSGLSISSPNLFGRSSISPNLFGRSSPGVPSQSLLGRAPGSGAYQQPPPAYLYPFPYPYPRPHP
jgi:hypothetical protein